jgi:hypothetical protein
VSGWGRPQFYCWQVTHCCNFIPSQSLWVRRGGPGNVSRVHSLSRHDCSRPPTKQKAAKMHRRQDPIKYNTVPALFYKEAYVVFRLVALSLQYNIRLAPTCHPCARVRFYRGKNMGTKEATQPTACRAKNDGRCPFSFSGSLSTSGRSLRCNQEQPYENGGATDTRQHLAVAASAK